jgi:hypothetical protein
MKQLIQEGYNNYHLGEPISNAQLRVLINNHRKILQGLDELNEPMFHLFRVKIKSDLSNLEGFLKARKEGYKRDYKLNLNKQKTAI